MFVFALVLFWSSESHAFLDFIANSAREAVEIAAYVDATSELAGEISPDDDIKNGARDVNARADRLRSEAYNLKYMSQTTKSILSGPDWSSKRLETNIRSTTDYIRRLKRLITRAIALGPQGATAVATTETNMSLNEVQKNQQIMIMQNQDMKIAQMEREHEQAKEWDTFSKQQKKIRGNTNGKF